MGHPARAPELRRAQDALATELAREAITARAACQEEAELAEFVALLARRVVPVRVVAEIGCWRGGTLWLWKQIAREVYGVTLPDGLCQSHGAQVLFADSHSRLAREWLGQAPPLDMLFIDGDHSAQGVALDWAAFSPLVRPGGLAVLHDVANPADCPDVVDFWQSVSAGHPGCRVIHHPGGMGIGIMTMEASHG